MTSVALTRRALLGGLAVALPTATFSGEKIYRRKGDAPAPANLIRVVQTKLTECGYAPGPVDGLMGPKTRSGIRNFQGANGLTVTGEIDDPLLVALGLLDPNSAPDAPVLPDAIKCQTPSAPENS